MNIFCLFNKTGNPESVENKADSGLKPENSRFPVFPGMTGG
jgi:hypothetical protein